MTNYSMTLSDEQLEIVQNDISTAKTAANVKQTCRKYEQRGINKVKFKI